MRTISCFFGLRLAAKQSVCAEINQKQAASLSLFDWARILNIFLSQIDISFADNDHLHRKLLRAGNLNVEGTIKVLRSFLQMIGGNPLYFENVLPFEKSDPVWNMRVVSTPPLRDQHGRRLFLMRAGEWNPDKVPFAQASSET